MRCKMKLCYLGRLLLLYFFTVCRQVRLPRLIRDSMILQRDTEINIWGWAAKDEKINIKFQGKTYKTTTGADGKWILYCHL